MDEKSVAFHAGTIIKNNKIVSNGGRVMAVTSYGKNIETSLKVCYENVEKITFEKKQFRKDIGKDLITKK